jgi:hypothetical protein
VNSLFKGCGNSLVMLTSILGGCEPKVALALVWITVTQCIGEVGRLLFQIAHTIGKEISDV